MSTAILASYDRQNRRNALLVGALGLAALAGLVVGLVAGPAGVPLGQALRAPARRCSTSQTMSCMIDTASTGYWPEADSADSITASAPS